MSKSMPIPERFWEKVDRRSAQQCWEWRGALNRRGYGNFSLGDGNFQGAHRYSWGLAHGETPPSKIFVCHKCDNRKCVNPNHLFLGSAMDNTRDMIAKGRFRLRKGLGGETHPVTTLSRKKCLDILSASGTQKEIAEKFEVSTGTVSLIKTGLHWSVRA